MKHQESPNTNTGRIPEELPIQTDPFAFYSVAGKICSDIIENVYGGNDNMTEEEKKAWSGEFLFFIHKILAENPDIAELYTRDRDAAVLMVQNKIKKMHPLNS